MSKGARFIWNTEYFHIAKPGEAYSKYAKSPTAAMNLVEYCATREGVALCLDEKYWYDPPTQKQLDLIRDLEEAIGEDNKEKYQDSFEYRDYIESPNKGNASEYITFLSERLRFAGSATSEYTANLIEYAAKRPGVQKFHSEHGLFSSEKVDLEEAKEHVATHDGNIWTHVLSLRREDAQMLGYESAEPWRELVMSKLDILAEAHNIKLENLEWYAAMHNESHHPHIHLFIMSKDPNEGFFSEEKFQSISRCKSEFANTIFAEEMYNEYTQKEDAFQQIKNELNYELKSLLDNPLSSYSAEDKQFIIDKMIDLSRELSLSKGQKVYGYLNPALKNRVNELLHHIVYDNEHLSALYKKWCEHQFSIERIYLNNPNETPIEKQGKNFNLFRNMIIKQCSNIEVNKVGLFLDENIDSNYSTFNISDSEKNIQKSYTKKKELDFDMVRFRAEHLEYRNAYYVRKLADFYNYGDDNSNVSRNIDDAAMWYGIAADQFDDGLSAYKLGQIYLKGSSFLGKNIELGHDYCLQAYHSFKESIENFEFFDTLEKGNIDLNFIEFYDDVSKLDSYKEYLIGRMYLKGEGVAQNYTNSLYSFGLAAKHGYKHANYYIGNQFYYGLGVKQDFTRAFEYYQKAENPYGYFRMAKMYINGEGVPSNLKQAELYLENSKNSIAAAGYELARLYENNEKLFKKSSDEIFSLYKHSLVHMLEQEKNYQDGFTEIRIAGLYLEGKGTDVNVEEALRWLKISSENDNPDAAYQLGYIYSTEKYNLNNTELSQQNYQKALEEYIKQEKENSNANAEFRVALIYLNSLNGEEINSEEAIRWLTKSAENHSPTASYKLAQIYEKGELLSQDINMALTYYQLSSELGNLYAHYRLGTYELERDEIDKSICYFEQAAKGEMSYAYYKLGQIYSSEEYGHLDIEKSQENYAKAMELFKRDFQESKEPFSAYRIGSMYQKGLGTEKDLQSAVEWYTEAANLGSPDAAYQLGYIYRDTTTSFCNYSLSQHYFSMSLRIYLDIFENNSSDGYAAMKIGSFYQYGLGVEKNIDKAIEYYLKASELGNSSALERINAINEEQTAALMSLATTAAHLGRMFQNDVNNIAQSRLYRADSKILRQEKKLKIESGQAYDDYSQY